MENVNSYLKKNVQFIKLGLLNCRTWPFGSKNMNAKTWDKDISTFCPVLAKENFSLKKNS